MKSNNQDITDTGLDTTQMERLRNASLNPPAGAWLKIQQTVRRKSQLIILYRAAAVVALLGVIIFVIQLSGSDSAEIQRQVAKRPIEKSEMVSAPAIADMTKETKSAGPVATRPIPSQIVESADTRPRTRTDVQAHAESTVLPETVSESIVVSEVVQPTEVPSAAPLDEASLPTEEASITIIYQLPVPEYEAHSRQATVSRIFGFAADLKSGQANLGLFRSIRQVLSEPARRINQQNTNLQ